MLTFYKIKYLWLLIFIPKLSIKNKTHPIKYDCCPQTVVVNVISRDYNDVMTHGILLHN